MSDWMSIFEHTVSVISSWQINLPSESNYSNKNEELFASEIPLIVSGTLFYLDSRYF